MKALNIRPFTRIVWRSNAIKEEWQNRLRKASDLYSQAEYQMVVRDKRKCGTVHIEKENFDEMLKKFTNDGIYFMPIRRTAHYSGFCLTGDTLVYTNPEFNRLDEIQVGDKLSIGNVIAINHETTNNVIEVKPQFLEGIKMTPNHRVKIAVQNGGGKKRKITQIKWKFAKDLERIKDCVIIPKSILIENEVDIDFNKYIKKNNPHFPMIMKFDEDLAYLFGWFLAEGYAHTWKKRGIQDYSYISFALSQDEEQIADKLKSIIKNKFGLYVRIRENNKGRKDYSVETTSNVLARFLIDNFGGKSHNKKLPDFIFKSKKSLIWIFINAYLQGDGWIIKGGRRGSTDRTYVDSVSKQLIKQLQVLLLNLGYPAAFQRIKGVGGFCNGGYKYRLGFSPTTNKHYWLEDANNFYFPIRKLEKQYGNFDVYDLQTDVGIYQVPFIVHNSHTHLVPQNNEPYSVYGVIAKNKEDALSFANSETNQGTDHKLIGNLLNYPKCCIEAFTERWGRGIIDPMMEATNSDKNIIELDSIPIETNQLLRYFGFRITSHLPCNFDCKDTTIIGKGWEEIMQDINLSAFNDLIKLLNLPLVWDAYRGILEVTTPIFKGITTTGFTEHRNIIKIGDLKWG